MCVINKKYVICHILCLCFKKICDMSYVFINVYALKHRSNDPSLQSVQVLAQLYRTEQDGKAVSKRKELKISYVFIPVYTQ